MFSTEPLLTVDVKNVDSRNQIQVSDRLAKDFNTILNGLIPKEATESQTDCMNSALEAIGKGKIISCFMNKYMDLQYK